MSGNKPGFNLIWWKLDANGAPAHYVSSLKGWTKYRCLVSTQKANEYSIIHTIGWIQTSQPNIEGRERQKERLASTGKEEDTREGFFWTDSHQSVGRILAYLLDSQGGEKKKLSAVTMVSFTFSLWNFTLSSDDCFVSGKNRLNCPERVVFEEIDPVWVIISGQLWKYGDRYRCFMS